MYDNTMFDNFDRLLGNLITGLRQTGLRDNNNGQVAGLVDTCQFIRSSLPELIFWCKYNDLNADTPANGFRCIFRTGTAFAEIILTEMAKPRFRDESVYDLIRIYRAVVEVMLQVCADLRATYDIRETDLPKAIDRLNRVCDRPVRLHSPSEANIVFLIRKVAEIQPHLGPLFGKYSSPLLCPSMRRYSNLVPMGLGIMFGSKDGRLLNAAAGLVSAKSRGNLVAHYVTGTDMKRLKTFLNLMENPINRKMVPSLSCMVGVKQTKVIQLPRQSRWLINNDRGVRRGDAENRDPTTIRCRLLRGTASGPSTNDAVVFHVHGGAFVAQSPDFHESYLREWAKKFKTVPIISVDNSKSPGSKFPAPLQDVLDAYLWLTSGRQEVRDLLGFTPAHIVLAGDSSGACFVTALCLVLNDIGKACPPEDKAPLMPAALVCFFAVFSLQMHLSPSKLTTLWDPIIFMSIALGVQGEYALTDDEDERVADVKPSLAGRLKRLVPCRSKCPPEPWFHQSDEKILAKIKAINAVCANPYISPLLYEDFESLSAVPLTIVTISSDILLDDCVDFAGRWCGPVTFDVVDGLCHGFLNFSFVSREAKTATDKCWTRLWEAVLGPGSNGETKTLNGHGEHRNGTPVTNDGL